MSIFRVGQLRAETNLTMTGSTFRFFIKLNRIYNSVVITLFLQVSESVSKLILQDISTIQTFVLWFLVYLTLFIDVKDFNNRFSLVEVSSLSP